MNISKADEATIKYYDDHAEDYELSTAGIKLTEQWEAFTSRLTAKGKVLDVGCGGGRDILHFQQLGFTVEALEPTPKLARIAREKTNATIHELSVLELTARCRYDGVWACASLLHLPAAEIKAAINKLSVATKHGGYIYISLKEGADEIRKPDGRLFTSFTEDGLNEISNELGSLQVIKLWTTEDAAQRSGVRWLNILFRKST